MGAKAGALQSAELGNFGAQLVHNNLQMRSMGATESALNHSKQKKRGEYEQGRKISKPPRPDVGDRPRTAPQLVASMLQEAIVSGSAASERDRKSTRLNSSHLVISYAVFCLKKKVD